MTNISENIICVGECGSMYLLINRKDKENTDTPKVKAAVVKMSNDDDAYLLHTYETIDQPLKFNAFTDVVAERSVNLPQVINRKLTSEEVTQINTYLES